MNNNIFISIIINCYNGEKFLDEALSSVLNQSYLNWELIFWDNQSTDKSAEIVKTYNNPKIRYFLASEHTSLGEARFLALEKTKGDWIAFLDCDDFWDKEKLQYQVNAINAYKGEVGLVYSNCQYFKDLIRKNRVHRLTRIVPGKKKLPQGKVSRYLFSGNFIPLPSILYKKSAVLKAGNISEFKFCPDYFLNLSISLKYNVIAINKTLSFYRLHNSNLSIGRKEIAILEAIYIIKILVNDKKLQPLLRAFQVRYLFYLLENFEFMKMVNLLKEINLPNIFLGILDIINYRIKFNTKI